MKPIRIISTGAESLQKDRATLVLRLGAALNSIRAAQRWTLNNAPDNPVAEFDRLQSFLVATACLAEACKLFWVNQECILELARIEDVKNEKIESLILIADPKSEMQTNLLKRIRDKVTFHWDCDVFEQWASAQKNSVVWLRSSGENAGEYVMAASHDALVRFIVGNVACNDYSATILNQIENVLKAMEIITYVFEFAVRGFLRHCGAQDRVEIQ